VLAPYARGRAEGHWRRAGQAGGPGKAVANGFSTNEVRDWAKANGVKINQGPRAGAGRCHRQVPGVYRKVRLFGRPVRAMITQACSPVQACLTATLDTNRCRCSAGPYLRRPRH